MIKKEILDRLFRLRLTNEDKSNLYNILSKKLGKLDEMNEISSKLNLVFSDLIREYLGKDYMDEFRKIKRIVKTGKKLIICLNQTDKIPSQLPDPEDKIKIQWYEDYKLIDDNKKMPIMNTASPNVTIELDEDFPSIIFDKNGEDCIIELKQQYSLQSIKDIEVFNINDKTDELIDKIYYLYIEYFKYYFIHRNLLRDTLYGSNRYYFLQYVSTWKNLYNICHEWMELLYDYYTIGDGFNDDIRFKYIEENSKDKVEELINYVLE